MSERSGLEKAVTFRNKNNQLLFGILHIPEDQGSASRIGINILNPGLKNRVAPNRINVKMARMFCAMGFYVFRSDPFGLGDSEGELETHESVMDLWGMIQRGLFVSDTLVANEFFIQEAGLDQLILVGQCGAAVTGMLVGAEDTRIEGMILVDSPVRLLSSQVDMSDILVETHRPSEMMIYYAKKILDGRSWVNLFSFKSNFGGLWSLLRRTAYSFFRRKKNSGAEFIFSERFNKKFLEAFCDFMDRKKKIYFLFAENDFALKEFQQDMQENFLNRKSRYQSQYQIGVIADANHVYTEEKWQDDLLGRMNVWLSQFRGAI